jgi:hypothetical protein
VVVATTTGSIPLQQVTDTVRLYPLSSVSRPWLAVSGKGYKKPQMRIVQSLRMTASHIFPALTLLFSHPASQHSCIDRAAPAMC